MGIEGGVERDVSVSENEKLGDDETYPPSFPYGEVLLSEYKRYGPREPLGGGGRTFDMSAEDSLKKMRTVIAIVSKHFAQGATSFEKKYHESDEDGARLPYSRVNLREIAEEVFATLHVQADSRPAVPSDDVQKPHARSKKEFIFTGLPKDTTSGGMFEWAEFATAAALRYLPHALEALSRGQALADHHVYTFGWPTSPYGRVTREYVDEVLEKGFEGFGTLHHEFIAQEIAGDTTSVADSVTLTGISFGASVAAVVGKKLLDDGTVTQKVPKRGASKTSGAAESPTDKGPKLPRLFVTMYVPAGVRSEGETFVQRALRMPIGLAREAVTGRVRSPLFGVLARAANGFDEAMRETLERGKKDDAPDSGDSQALLGEQCLWACRFTVIKGEKVPEGVAVKMVYGADDQLTYFPQEVWRRRAKKWILMPDGEGVRRRHAREVMNMRSGDADSSQVSTFQAEMPHLFRFAFRNSTFQLCDAIARSMCKIEADAATGQANVME